MQESRIFKQRQVLTISIAHLVHDIYSSFLAPILPLLIAKLGITYSMVGLLTAIQRAPALLNPFVGLLADKIALRYLVIISPAITSISMSLIGVADNVVFLSILLLVMGISSTFFHVPAPVMIKKVSGNKVGRGMGWFMFGGELARTLGPLVILGAVSLWGLEGTYKLIPFGLAATLLLFFEFRKIKISEEYKSNRKNKSISVSIKPYIPFFMALAGFTFFRAIIKSALTTFLPTYLTLQGESLWMGGISLAVLELAGAAGTLLAGGISDRFGRKNTLLIISIMTPLLMLLFLVSSEIYSFIILVLIGLFMFGSTPIILAFIQDKAKERPAFMNSIYMTISFGLGALGVLIVGALSDIFNMEISFQVSAFLSFGAIPFVFLLKE
ncbi:MFS transporter [Bacteroidota bacterium]